MKKWLKENANMLATAILVGWLVGMVDKTRLLNAFIVSFVGLVIVTFLEAWRDSK